MYDRPTDQATVPPTADQQMGIGAALESYTFNNKEN